MADRCTACGYCNQWKNGCPYEKKLKEKKDDGKKV